MFGGEERAELFRGYVGGPGLRVIDLGCRYGALTRVYADGNEVVGVAVGIETLWADVSEALPFPDANFDVVVAGELLEHVPDPAAVVAEARRLLRPGGTFVGSVPNAFRLKNRLRFAAGLPPENDPTHLHMFRPEHVRRLLSRFADVRLHLIAGRFTALSRPLVANDIVFAARRA